MKKNLPGTILFLFPMIFSLAFVFLDISANAQVPLQPGEYPIVPLSDVGITEKDDRPLQKVCGLYFLESKLPREVAGTAPLMLLAYITYTQSRGGDDVPVLAVAEPEKFKIVIDATRSIPTSQVQSTHALLRMTRVVLEQSPCLKGIVVVNSV